MPEQLMKPKQFCTAIGITYKTFSNWVKQGNISVITTPTKRYLIPESEYIRITTYSSKEASANG